MSTPDDLRQHKPPIDEEAPTDPDLKLDDLFGPLEHEFGYVEHKGTNESQHDALALGNDANGEWAVVCDGSGTSVRAQIAAMLGTETIGKNCRAGLPPATTTPQDVLKRMDADVRQADQVVASTGHEYPDCANLGTTCVYGMRVGNYVHVVGVGDSRAYGYDGEALTQLTKDHIGDEANVITSWLGYLGNVWQNEVRLQRLMRGETGGILLLCSDGLYKVLSKEEIEEVLEQGGSAQSLCDELLRRVLAKGRKRLDNITIVIVRWFRSRPV